MALPGLRSPEVSPDGRLVAWTWYRTAPVAEVYVAPTDASTPPTRLTDTLENTYLVNWTPDSRAVLVEQDKSTVTVVHDGVFKPSDSVFDPEYSSDGKVIQIFEYWQEGEGEDFCFQAKIVINDPPSGKYEVHWYIGNAGSPAEIVEFTVN